jgi:ketosteroid isomerase-like protein
MSTTDEIRHLLERRVDAMRRHDATAANAALDRAIVAFEVAGPLQTPARQATDVAATQAWLDSFAEGPFVTMDALAIHAEGAVAYCHSLNRLRGRGNDGREIDVTMRSTMGLRKSSAGWTIVHAHTSLPR